MNHSVAEMKDAVRAAVQATPDKHNPHEKRGEGGGGVTCFNTHPITGQHCIAAQVLVNLYGKTVLDGSVASANIADTINEAGVGDDFEFAAIDLLVTTQRTFDRGVSNGANETWAESLARLEETW